MYTSVEEGARATGCSAVVDLGSGKGYLSQVEVFVRTQEQKRKSGFQAVSAMSSLPVLAVEGEEGNTSGAAQRCVFLGFPTCFL